MKKPAKKRRANEGMIAVGSDHASFELKEHIKSFLEGEGYEVLDCGTYSTESCDYPIITRDTCKKVVDGTCEKAIICCGTGIGVSIASNKVMGIRAALCSEPVSAGLARAHNDANVLCMGGRMIGKIMAEEIIKAFLTTPHDAGRHARRVAQIAEIDETRGR